MKDEILITQLNDFIFCPASIYFHNLYGSMEKTLYQSAYQLNGSKAHEAVDQDTYKNNTNYICGLDVYSERYRLIGKIDQYDTVKKMLIERKRKISRIYDGYVFQIYAQYYAMTEMGYEVRSLRIYSMSDNKSYPILLPENDSEMKQKFEDTIQQMRIFRLEGFHQENSEKCKMCIYEPACSMSEIQGSE